MNDFNVERLCVCTCENVCTCKEVPSEEELMGGGQENSRLKAACEQTPVPGSTACEESVGTPVSLLLLRSNHQTNVPD